MLLQKAEENKDYVRGHKEYILIKSRRTGALNMQKIMKDMMNEK